MFHLDQYQKRLKFWGHILQTSFFFITRWKQTEGNWKKKKKHIYIVLIARVSSGYTYKMKSLWSVLAQQWLVTSLRYMAGNSVMVKLKLAEGMYCFAGSAFRSAFRSGRGMGVEADTKSGTLILGWAKQFTRSEHHKRLWEDDAWSAHYEYMKNLNRWGLEPPPDSILKE